MTRKEIEKAEAYWLHMVKTHCRGDSLSDVLGVWRGISKAEFLTQYEATYKVQSPVNRKAFDQGFRNIFGVAFNEVHA